MYFKVNIFSDVSQSILQIVDGPAITVKRSFDVLKLFPFIKLINARNWVPTSPYGEKTVRRVWTARMMKI